VPIAYWLVIQFADQFLALRGLAALLLQVAKVALDAADLSDLPLRLIVTVLAYLWVYAAIWMASPRIRYSTSSGSLPPMQPVAVPRRRE
jgi:hypothetical protein